MFAIFKKNVSFETILNTLVAFGGAIQAAALERKSDVPRIFLKSVTPLSLGLQKKNRRWPRDSNHHKKKHTIPDQSCAHWKITPKR